MTAHPRDPWSALSDEGGFDRYVYEWLKKKYGSFDPFLCDALSASAQALMSIVRETAVTGNPDHPDYRRFWQDPDFVMAAVMSPFHIFNGPPAPLFNSKEFFTNVGLMKRVLKKKNEGDLESL